MNVMQKYQAMDYAPALESRAEADAWLRTRRLDKGLFIDGKWRAATDGASFDVHDPSSGALLGKVAEASSADVDAAVAAARRALPRWQTAGAYGRARVLYAIGRSMQRHARLFAVLESLDNGKPIRESRDIDVPLAIRHFLHHAGWAQNLAENFPGQTAVGVAGQIIP